jgi:hypothetical protein
MPLMKEAFPDQPFRLLEISVGATGSESLRELTSQN